MLPKIDVLHPVKIGRIPKNQDMHKWEPPVWHISLIITPIFIGEFLRVSVTKQKMPIGTNINFRFLAPEKDRGGCCQK